VAFTCAHLLVNNNKVINDVSGLPVHVLAGVSP